MRDSGWLIVLHGDTRIALRQSQVHSMGEMASLGQATAPGVWQDSRRDWFAFNLDARLAVKRQWQVGRFVVYLEALHQPLGWICDEVRLVGADEELVEHPLPEVIAREAGAANGLLELSDGDIATIINGNELAFALNAHVDYGVLDRAAEIAS